MKIDVTTEDIQGIGHYSGDNPITRALRRCTGQTWVVFGGTTAYLRSEPFRSVALPYEVFSHWKLHQDSGVWQPFEFEIDVRPATSTRRSSDRRQGSRRAAPRFGFDRRAHDRRAQSRRQHDRRGGEDGGRREV